MNAEIEKKSLIKVDIAPSAHIKTLDSCANPGSVVVQFFCIWKDNFSATSLAFK